jgi:hypothetical protein
MPGGRPKGIWTPQIVRDRIQTTKLVDRLTDHVLGKVEMQPTQVTAALGLLKKALPDLSATEFTGTVIHRDANELSDSELADIAAGRRSQDAGATSSKANRRGVRTVN